MRRQIFLSFKELSEQAARKKSRFRTWAHKKKLWQPFLLEKPVTVYHTTMASGKLCDIETLTYFPRVLCRKKNRQEENNNQDIDTILSARHLTYLGPP